MWRTPILNFPFLTLQVNWQSNSVPQFSALPPSVRAATGQSTLGKWKGRILLALFWETEQPHKLKLDISWDSQRLAPPVVFFSSSSRSLYLRFLSITFTSTLVWGFFAVRGSKGVGGREFEGKGRMTGNIFVLLKKKPQKYKTPTNKNLAWRRK